MPLQRGKVLGYDFNRMVVDFTMFNQGKARAHHPDYFRASLRDVESTAAD